MKKAFSALELIIVVFVLCACILMFGKNTNPIQSAIKERNELNTKVETVNKKLDELQEMRNNQNEQLQRSLENNY